ncbi:MAG: hypothetical protein ACTSRI_14085 [Promethearchaeota archaeon]
MGFFTSFIIICFLGFFSHLWYHKYGLSKGHLAWISYYTLFVIAGFLILDVLIYIGALDFIFPFLNQLVPWLNIDNGKDFMWNSFQIFGLDWNVNYNDPNLKFIALLLFLSYPMWYFSFKDFSRKLFGGNRNRPFEKGLWYLFARVKKAKKGEKIAEPPKMT